MPVQIKRQSMVRFILENSKVVMYRETNLCAGSLTRFPGGRVITGRRVCAPL